ncbi:WD40-repeat-containing domain [Pseudocohnilembus persalinus]|uniref:WD40-repeat-containing domain n=1 Tax=Pseudocohnilembus persalinus TaxID=266149 RepID=A0A0V0QBZ8_PSEPJ|nr:WD40-repeat-containing domain [Pseudocohnilembus persalinus]|eukprot:KRW99659.1 WD40-repeat-containing domain [Pseudocohnilembus persalinus]
MHQQFGQKQGSQQFSQQSFPQQNNFNHQQFGHQNSSQQYGNSYNQQQQQQQQYSQNFGNQQQQLDCLELDHLVGFSGKFPNSAHFHPQDREKIIYAIGGLVVIENLQDKHDQIFLRGHDSQVSSIAVSPSGRFIASGQVGSLQTKYHESPGITNIAFSYDDKFLAVTGASNTITIWNTQDFSIVYNKLFESPVTLIAWSSVTKSATKHNKYILVTAQGNTIKINSLDFNLGSMQYQLTSSTCQLPSSGLIRTYSTAIIDPRGEFIYCGTTAGELCIYNIPNQVFKAAIPISTNGVLSLTLINDTLIVGSGDGKIKKLQGQETKWSVEAEVQLDGALNGQSLSPDGSEVLVSSSNSKIYRVLTNTIDATVHNEGHISPIIDVAFQKGKNDLFVTIDAQGYIFVWDNNELNVITKCVKNGFNKSQGLCVTIANDDGTVIAGYDDGFVKCFQITNQNYSPFLWEMVNCHKGGVTSIYADENYILTGGRDGQVRIWSRVARQLLQQISIHTRDVIAVFPDIQQSHIIHSASTDKSIHSYDLKLNKKLMYHQAKNGTLLGMSQRKDHEQELVTCGLNTPILFWDCDVVEPVQLINVNEKLNTIQVSPTGKYLAVGDDKGEVVVYLLSSTKQVGKFLGHSGPVSKLKWSPDEKQIISISFDSSLCVWNFFED